MSADPAAIMPSLEACAANLGDIVPQVYARFFELHPAALELMGHSDEHMRGRMFEQTLELLMSDEHLGPEGYLNWELDNHLLSYQVHRDMYVAFFSAIRDVVQSGAGDAWTSADASAWQQRIDYILQLVFAHPAAQA